MNRCLTTRVVGLLIVAMLGLAPIAQAADDEDRETIKPKVERRRPATSIDFAYELELSFQSLAKLGAQIEEHREAPDPVGLASAAKLLQVAEEIAGKKAPLTAAELQKEAVELAKLRSIPSELTAIASLTGNEELNELAEAAKTRDKEEQAAAKSGDASKELHGDLHVHNHSHEGFHVYANGRHLGYVHPHGERTWHLHDVHHIDARNHFHRVHRHIHGRKHHYDFYIHGDH